MADFVDGDAQGPSDSSSRGAEGTQLAVQFVTKLGPDLQVPEFPVTIPSDLSRYGLSQIINTLLELDPPRPFDFLVDHELVRAPLAKILARAGISAESILTIEYVPAVLPPTAKQECPHDDWVTSVVDSSVSKVATTGSSDGLIRSWDLSANRGGGQAECSNSFIAHHGGVNALAMAEAPTAGSLLFSGGKDGVVRLWHKESEGWSELLATYKGHTDAVEDVAVSLDGKQMASCGWDGSIRLWRAGDTVVNTVAETSEAKPKKKGTKKQRTATGEAATSVPEGGLVEEAWGHLDGHAQCVSSVTWADSSRLVSGSWDHSVRVWDAATCTNVSTLNAPKAIHCLAVAEGGVTVFGSSDRVLRVWDPRGQGEALNLRGLASHGKWIKCLSRSTSSPHHFVSGSYDCTLKVWDLRASIPLATVTGHSDKVLCTTWEEGGRLLSGGADCTLRIHDADVA